MPKATIYRFPPLLYTDGIKIVLPFQTFTDNVSGLKSEANSNIHLQKKLINLEEEWRIFLIFTFTSHKNIEDKTYFQILRHSDNPFKNAA